MIHSLTTIEGLGGTGKTTEIMNTCKGKSVAGIPVVYVTYNKQIATSLKAQIELPLVSISTLHSLIFHELDAAGQLPEAFTKKSTTELTASDDDFAKLETIFLSFFGESNSFTIFSQECTLIVDEFQNISIRLCEVLNLICQKCDVELYLIGDRYQGIYSYRKENARNNFEHIETIFGKRVDREIILNENHRSQPEVLALINAFLKKNINVDSRYLYTIGTKQSKEKQNFCFFTNRQEEFEYVKREAIRYHDTTGKDVVILSRANRNLALFEEWKKSDTIEWLSISSIHKYIGKEAPLVFMTGVEVPDSRDEAMVYYTGLIRAREKIVLTSSFPAFDSKAFADDALEVVNRQKRISKPFKQLKDLKDGKNLTRKKFENCSIDSITLAVKYDALPFLPFIKRDAGLDSNAYAKSRIISSKGIPIKVSYYTKTRSIYFEMKDVNKLRRCNYNDVQVVQFLSNFILDFFNYQVSVEDITIHSIDLCRIVEKEDSLVSCLEEGRMKYKSIVNDNKEIVGKFSLQEIQERTIYYNFTSAKSKSVTLVVYRPIDKENKNRYFDPKAIKLELRLKKDGFCRKYAFGEEMNMRDFISKLKEDKDYLKKAFDRVFIFRTVKKVEGV